MLFIRAMQATDLAVVLDIQARCYGGGLPESGESLGAKLRAAPGSCFVAVHEDAVRGYLFSLPWQLGSLPSHDAPTCALPANPDCFYLHDLAVHPDARGSGAASALVARFLACAHALDHACLVAVQDSSGYWVRHGFSVVTSADLHPASLVSYGDQAIYMHRAFQKSP